VRESIQIGVIIRFGLLSPLGFFSLCYGYKKVYSICG
jgi:hypothetical protein